MSIDFSGPAMSSDEWEDLRDHGLRKYGATRLAENGATEWEVMAFLAHKDPREARRYVKAANRNRLTESALARVNPQSVVQPFERLDKYKA